MPFRVFDSFGRQGHDPRPRLETGTGFIERDVSVRADADNQQIDAAHISNLIFIPATLRVCIDAGRSIGNARVVDSNIHVIEEASMHIGVIALGIIRSKPQIFVKIECSHSREVEILFAMSAD